MLAQIFLSYPVHRSLEEVQEENVCVARSCHVLVDCMAQAACNHAGSCPLPLIDIYVQCSLAEQQAAEKKGRLTGKQFFLSQEAEVCLDDAYVQSYCN